MAEARGVLVTGGGAGIGLAVARRFARMGDRVVIMGRNEETLDAARDKLRVEALEVDTFVGSVADPGSADAAVEKTEAVAGHLDVVVNNAGVCIESELSETTEADWDAMFDINVKGVYLVTQAALKRMRPRRSGVVIVTSSINAKAPEPLYVAYSATKAAVESFVAGLALEVAEHGIRVCAVAPGYIVTPMLRKTLPDEEEFQAWRDAVTKRVPMGRFASPDEVAGAFSFLASEDAKYITGSVVTVDGGRLAG